MIEENKQGDNGKLEPEKIETVKELKLSITKNIENGQISVQGPGNGDFYDKWVCLGMLDDAKDFIKMHNAKVAQGNIVRANPSMAQQVRGIFHKRR